MALGRSFDGHVNVRAETHTHTGLRMTLRVGLRKKVQNLLKGKFLFRKILLTDTTPHGSTPR